MSAGRRLLGSATAAIAVAAASAAVVAPASAAAGRTSVPSAVAAGGWTVRESWARVGTYPTLTQCVHEGKSSGQVWNCKPSTVISGQWDLFIKVNS